MKKKVHHGGAWKVVYADFVTGMMALFIVLWLTSQDQRIKDAVARAFAHPFASLTKAADAMPGFGIVAAVLGIVLTMSSISGPAEEIGTKVGAALVGTFLGIFLSYGFMNPLAVNIEFMNLSEMAYIRCIAASVIGFAGGMSPIMAVEVARRGLPSEVKPSADGLEAMLKGLSQTPAK